MGPRSRIASATVINDIRVRRFSSIHPELEG